MTDHASRNYFTHVGTDGWTMNLDRPDHSMIDGDESWLGPRSKISGSLPTALAGDFVDLDELERQCRSLLLEGGLQDWVMAMHGRATSLLAAQDRPKRRKAEQMLAAAVQSMALLLAKWTGRARSTDLRMNEAVLEKDLGKAPGGWDRVCVPGGCLHHRTGPTTSHGRPVILSRGGDARTALSSIRYGRGFSPPGGFAFDGLLARAKTLLRDHPAVRARIKQTYRAILVDEFQDTDPVQYEIILYLGERAGSHRTAVA